MGLHGQKIERHVVRHQLHVHGGHTGIMWMRVKGWWILQDEDKLRRSCRSKNRTKTPKNGGRRRRRKRMQSPAGGCAEENIGTAQIKYGREVGRRLPPTRIIERNDR